MIITILTIAVLATTVFTAPLPATLERESLYVYAGGDSLGRRNSVIPIAIDHKITESYGISARAIIEIDQQDSLDKEKKLPKTKSGGGERPKFPQTI